MKYLLPTQVRICYYDEPSPPASMLKEGEAPEVHCRQVRYYDMTVYMRRGERPTEEQERWMYNEFLIETGRKQAGQTGSSIVKYTA